MAGSIDNGPSVVEQSDSLAGNGDKSPASDPRDFIKEQGESLDETEVSRDPRVENAMRRNHAANRLAAANRTNRLLWIALILSLAAHVIVPIYLVSAMTKPEKVALMDGTESLIITPLVPAEQSDEILNTVSYWAAKSFLDRGPQGFDAPDTLNRVFLPRPPRRQKTNSRV